MDATILMISMVITWGIGMTPPLLIRYLLVKKPLEKKISVVIIIIQWVVNLMIFTALGSQSKTHTVLYIMAFVSYCILRKDKKGTPVVGKMLDVNKIAR